MIEKFDNALHANDNIHFLKKILIKPHLQLIKSILLL